MKITKQCPKCEGTALLKIDIPPTKYRYVSQIPMGLTLFSAVSVSRYVCCACGYSEEWIDKEDIPKLREKYPRVF